MITMMHCDHCGGDFSESLAESSKDCEPYEFWGQQGCDGGLMACPYCLSIEIDQKTTEAA